MEHQHAFEILARRVVRKEAKTNRANHTALQWAARNRPESLCQIVGYALKFDLGTSPPGWGIFIFEGFSTHKSAIETLNNDSVKTQAAILRGLRSEKSPRNRLDFWQALGKLSTANDGFQCNWGVSNANKRNENRSVRTGQSELANSPRRTHRGSCHGFPQMVGKNVALSVAE